MPVLFGYFNPQSVNTITLALSLSMYIMLSKIKIESFGIQYNEVA